MIYKTREHLSPHLHFYRNIKKTQCAHSMQVYWVRPESLSGEATVMYTITKRKLSSCHVYKHKKKVEPLEKLLPYYSFQVVEQKCSQKLSLPKRYKKLKNSTKKCHVLANGNFRKMMWYVTKNAMFQLTKRITKIVCNKKRKCHGMYSINAMCLQYILPWGHTLNLPRDTLLKCHGDRC